MSDELSHLPAHRIPAIRVIPMPHDSNPAGDVFGGWIMSQVDLAGSVPALRRACGRIVTVAVNSFHFKSPVYVGDVVSLYADIIETGRSSIKVAVEVYAERQHASEFGKIVKVTEAMLTYVAVDQSGKSRPLPAPQTLG